jgi:anaerobic carbon-monoxide dehydrogenase iron sulfur subunit
VKGIILYQEHSMTHPVLVLDSKKCTGCRICEQWCAWSHFGQVTPALARLRIRKDHRQFTSQIVACIQCEPAECMLVCPQEAIRRDPQTFGLLLDEDLCLLCNNCVDSCPEECIQIHPESQIPLLCDLCGGDPQCARHCPEGAILFVVDNQPAQAISGGYQP